jgi:multimeric flavodoxin WrbA
MKKLSIVYHTQSKSTEKLANYIYEGCLKENSVETHMQLAAEADSSILLSSNGIIFGTPENFGYMSGALKDFFDRTFYQVEHKNINIPYCIFVSAGNDGTGAVSSIERIASGYPLIKVAEPLIISGKQVNSNKKRCIDFGHGMAAGLALGIY